MDLCCKTCSKKFIDCKSHVDHFDFFHRVVHNSAFLCGVANCLTKLNSVKSYLKHFEECHQLPSYNQSELSYKCPSPGCDFKANSKARLRNHKFWKHREASSNQEENSEMNDTGAQALENFDSDEQFARTDEPIIESNVPHETLISEEDILSKLTHLLMTLNMKYHVPDSTVGHIVNNYSKLMTESCKITSKRLVDSLSGLSEERVETVVQSVITNDPLLKFHGPDGPLRSSYCRKKEYMKQFNYVKPVQISLGLNDANVECKYHYVPIKDSIRQFFNDESVYQQYVENRQKRQSVLVSNDLTDIHSGSSYKNNLFWNDPFRIEIILYQDEVDLCKAIGAASGSHKVLHMAFTLANLHPWNRSKVDPLQLILLAKETDVSYFGLIKILEPLIRDLCDLEENGIEIRGENFKASIVVLLGDNLGTHTIGGFLQNFSSAKYFCRYCEESRDEWRERWASMGECSESEDSDSEEDSSSEEDSDINEDNAENYFDEVEDSDDEDLADLIPLSELRKQLPKVTRSLRTVESYKKCVDRLAEHPSGVKGIIADSELNKLKHFKIVGGTPSCLPHDVFEGFAGYDLQLCLKRLCKLNKFSFDYINRRLKTFKFEGNEKLDKPPPKQAKDRKKIKGNAVQVWNFIRFLPLLISDKIKDKNDHAWVLIVTLTEITRLITSPVISKTCLKYIEELIVKYLQIRVALFVEPLRPKHHFFEHYPTLLSIYGPFMRTSTLRFEAKHKFYRSEFVNKKCLKNITKSLSNAHQIMQSALTIDNIFEMNPTMSNTFPYSSLQLDHAGRRCLISSFGAEIVTKLLYSSEVMFHNTLYKAGKIVVTSSVSKFKIKCLKMDLLLSDGVNAYALGFECEGELEESYQIFVLGASGQRSIMSLADLKDYVPYSPYPWRTGEALVLQHLYQL